MKLLTSNELMNRNKPQLPIESPPIKSNKLLLSSELMNYNKPITPIINNSYNLQQETDKLTAQNKQLNDNNWWNNIKNIGNVAYKAVDSLGNAMRPLSNYGAKPAGDIINLGDNYKQDQQTIIDNEQKINQNKLSLYEMNPLTDVNKQEVIDMGIKSRDSKTLQGGKSISGFYAYTADEKNAFNYALGTGGYDSAVEYSKLIQDRVNARIGKIQAVVVDALPKIKTPIQGVSVKDAAHVVTAAQGGLGQFGTGFGQVATRLTGNTVPIAKSPSEYALENLKSRAGTLGNVVMDVTSTTANMAPSIVAGIASPTVGMVLMGTSAGGQSYNQARREGKTDTEALAYGVANGLLEAATQKLFGGFTALKSGIAYKGISSGLGKLGFASTLKNVAARLASNPIASKVLKSLGNMASEGFEEWLQANIDPVLRNVIFDEKNAIKPFSADKLYQGLLGAFSAGGMNIGTGLIGKVQMPINETLAQQNAPSIVKTVSDIISEVKQGKPIEQVVLENPEVILTNENVPALYDEYGKEVVYAMIEHAKAVNPAEAPLLTMPEIIPKKPIQKPTLTKPIEKSILTTPETIKIVDHKTIGTDNMLSVSIKTQLNEILKSDNLNDKLIKLSKLSMSAMPRDTDRLYVNYHVSQVRNEIANSKGILERQNKRLEAFNKNMDKVMSENKTNIINKPTEPNPILTPVENLKLAKFNKVVDSQSSNVTDTALQRPVDELIKEYGAHEIGAKPVRDVKVPKKLDANTGISKHLSTIINSGIITDEQVKDLSSMDNLLEASYNIITDKAAQSYADQEIKNNGSEMALDRALKGTGIGHTQTKYDSVVIQTIMNNAWQNKNTAQAIDVTMKLVQQRRNAAQIVQSASMLQKLTPEWKFYMLQKSMEQINRDILTKYQGKFPQIKMDETLVNNLLNSKTQKETDIAIEAIENHVASKMPVSWAEKITAWRFTSMLATASMNVRNMVGNGMLYGMRKEKNLIGAIVEKLIPVDQRTKSIFKDKAAVDYAKTYFEENVGTIKGQGRYDDSGNGLINRIKDKRTIFKIPILEGIRKVTFAVPEAGDLLFLRGTFIDSFAQIMTARKLNPKTATPEQINNAVEYATEEALYATYRNFNQAASLMNKIENSHPVASVLTGGLLPFKKTLANIGITSVHYSPIGILLGVKDFAVGVRKWKIDPKQKGAKSPAQAINTLSKGLAGTSITAIGYLLGSLGILSVGGSDDKKQDQFDTLQGKRNYSLNIGGYSISLDWASPAAVPLFLGAEIQRAITSENPLKDISEAFQRIVGPLSDLTILNGLTNAVNAAKYSGNDAITAIGSQLAVNYATQFFPSMGGQVARSIDDVKRTTYVDKNKGSEFWQQVQQKVYAKIPLLSQTLPPKIDQWGRETETPNKGLNFFNNMLNPSIVTKIRTTPIDNELQRLYDLTGESTVIPSYALKNWNVEGQRKDLTAEEYTEFAKYFGKTSFDNLNFLINSKGYKNLSDKEKIGAIQDVYTYAKQTGKQNMSDFVPAKWVTRQKNTGLSVADTIIYNTFGVKTENKKAGLVKTLGYSEAKAFEIYNKMETYIYKGDELSESQAEKQVIFKSHGYNEDKYIKAYNATRGITATKRVINPNYSITTSSDKTNQMKALRDVGFSNYEAYFMYQILNGDIKS